MHPAIERDWRAEDSERSPKETLPCYVSLSWRRFKGVVRNSQAREPAFIKIQFFHEGRGSLRLCAIDMVHRVGNLLAHQKFFGPLRGNLLRDSVSDHQSLEVKPLHSLNDAHFFELWQM